MSCTFALLILPSLFGMAREQLPHEVELRHIKELYLANRSAFPFGTYHFDHLTGRAPNVADARGGRLEHSSTGRGFYSFDGKNARYDRLYDQEELLRQAVKVGEGQIRSSIQSFRVLTDGGSTLVDFVGPSADLAGTKHSAQIYPGTGYFYRNFMFPLDLGNPNSGSYDLSHDISSIESGESRLIEFEPNVLLEGQSVVHFSFQAKLGRRDYWVAMQLGGVPVQVIDLMDKSGNTTQFNNDEIRETNGGWLPHVSTIFLVKSAHVTRVSIRESETNAPPGRDVFRVQFPGPMPIIDNTRNLSYSARRTWSLLNLPSPNSLESRKIAVTEYATPAPEMPGERTGRPILALLFCVVGGGLAIFALLRFYKPWKVR